MRYVRCFVREVSAKMSAEVTQFFAMSAVFQYDFDHNSMRQRRIFDIVDCLNSAHFVLQNESSIVCFTYWVQMLLRCEIDGIAKRVRDHWNPDFDAKTSQSYQIWL